MELSVVQETISAKGEKWLEHICALSTNAERGSVR